MATTKYTKRTGSMRRVASGNAIGGQQLRLALNKDMLIEEHVVNITVSQGFATTIPTSIDVRDFIDTISVESSDGRRLYLSGAQAYDLARFTENSSNVVSSLAATSTAQYAFTLHYANDDAMFDLLTAMRSNELTSFDLIINFRADTANGFKGGVIGAGAAASYVVTVGSFDYDMLNEVQCGKKLGVYKHYALKQEVVGSTVGQQADIMLDTGNATRFIMIHTYNTTGAVPVLSDAILNTLRVNINGKDIRNVLASDVKADNVRDRNFVQVGVLCLDFGDDEAGWLSLENIQQAKIQWDTQAGAPASYALKIAQDYTRAV